MIETKERKYFRAKDRIKKIKNFRWFLLVTILASVYMIGFSSYLSYVQAEDSFVPTTIFLGSTLGLWIIVFLEYLKVFGSGLFFRKEWEERQIQKYMNETSDI